MCGRSLPKWDSAIIGNMRALISTNVTVDKTAFVSLFSLLTVHF